MTNQDPKSSVSSYVSPVRFPTSVGTRAPNFVAPAVLADNSIDNVFDFRNYVNGRYALLFFYPLDFTFVCPSEILAHNNRLEEFSKRNCAIVGVSVDSHFSHYAWKSMPVEKGGIGDLGFPLVSDLKKAISQYYGLLNKDGAAYRGTFLMDREGIIRHCVVNDLPLGRNVDEALRILDALQFHEANGEVCPAGWTKGDKGMQATKEGVASYLKINSKSL